LKWDFSFPLATHKPGRHLSRFDPIARLDYLLKANPPGFREILLLKHISFYGVYFTPRMEEDGDSELRKELRVACGLRKLSE
jgi:hypothetical protein